MQISWPFLLKRSDVVLKHVPTPIIGHFCKIVHRLQTLTHAGLQEWEAWCTSLVTDSHADRNRFQLLPQTLARYKILLHAFAGRRRRGDIEWFPDQLASQHSGYTIMIISIDIIIGSEFGDMSKTIHADFLVAPHQIGFCSWLHCGSTLQYVE